MTVSGVFSAWARLPAWRRASSACASLWASSWLISSVSGRISDGNSWLMRVFSPEPDRGDFAPHPAQRPQAVERLQRRQDQQPDAERGEAPEQGRAQFVDLLVDDLARLRDLEAPADLRARQDHVALGDPQRLGWPRREFVAVVQVRLRRRCGRSATLQPPVPQRARRESVGARAADLEIDARIGLDEALVGGRAVEADFAVGPDFRRGDHRIEDITSWLSKLSMIDRVSTRSSAKPPISSSAAIHSAATHDHPPGQRCRPPALARVLAAGSASAAVTGGGFVVQRRLFRL